MALVIDRVLCVGCGACVGGCPNGALELVGGAAAVDESRCVLCGVCVQSCPVGAIDIRREEAHTCDVSQYRDVWVFAEREDAQLLYIPHGELGQRRMIGALLPLRTPNENDQQLQAMLDRLNPPIT